MFKERLVGQRTAEVNEEADELKLTLYSKGSKFSDRPTGCKRHHYTKSSFCTIHHDQVRSSQDFLTNSDESQYTGYF